MTRVRTGGFTLIELLVVVSIIALLSSLMLASIVEARNQAHNAKVKQEINQYETALFQYMDENGEYPDPGDNDTYCLGDDYENDTCGYETTHSSEHTALKEQSFKKYISGLPSSKRIVNLNGSEYNGYWYECENRVGGKCTSVKIWWLLESASEEACGDAENTYKDSDGTVICTDTIEK